MPAAGSGSIETVVPVLRSPGSPATARAREWRRTLRRAVVATDVGLILMITSVSVLVGIEDPARRWEPGTTFPLAAVGVAASIVVLAVFRCWDQQVIGQGSEEFNRLLRAFLAASLAFAVTGLAFKIDEVRPWVFGVLPACGLAVLVGRYLVRRVLHGARRGSASCMSSVLVVGAPAPVGDLVARTRRVPHHGWSVVAACTPTGGGDDGRAQIHDVPVVGDLDSVAEQVRVLDVDVVAVAPAPGWSPQRLHRLAWQLEGRGVELVVDPGLMEIGGPRLHVALVDGLPLLRLTEPRLGGVTRVAKNALDRTLALLLLALLAPVLLVVAVLVKCDGGPVLYRQERVGLRGRTFLMLKFRSMVVDADRQTAVLVGADEGAGPLFKLKTDPRTTRVGRALRRLSLDELPQLVNVLLGTMSLVGPRPPLAREVETYADDARRKLLVRPGMTGLWQVSGRSDLSWEESVRLDLRYVENWSPALDAMILWKTVGAVFRKRGAY